jgi:hypothetical protein
MEISHEETETTHLMGVMIALMDAAENQERREETWTHLFEWFKRIYSFQAAATHHVEAANLLGVLPARLCVQGSFYL